MSSSAVDGRSRAIIEFTCLSIAVAESLASTSPVASSYTDPTFCPHNWISWVCMAHNFRSSIRLCHSLSAFFYDSSNAVCGTSKTIKSFFICTVAGARTKYFSAHDSLFTRFSDGAAIKFSALTLAISYYALVSWSLHNNLIFKKIVKNVIQAVISDIATVL